MTISTKAVERLQAVLDTITKDRSRWNQRVWLEKSSDSACGTVGCLAGNLVLQDPQLQDIVWHVDDVYSEVQHVVFPGGIEIVRDAAARILLDDYEALNSGDDEDTVEDLFNGHNRLEDLWCIGQLLAEGRLEIPES